MAEAKIFPPFSYGKYVSQEEKRGRTIRDEKERQRYWAMMASGSLPPGLEILEIPSTVAGEAPQIVYRYPCKMTRTTASERAAIRAARNITATTTAVGRSCSKHYCCRALGGGSVLNKDPGESSETVVENLKLEELRISN